MEERRCPKCEKPIAMEDEFCPSCGIALSQEKESLQETQEKPQPISPSTKKKPLERGLLAEVLIIVGFVVLGTLAVYSLSSIVSRRDWGAFFERVTATSAEPVPESATPAQSAKPDEKPDQQVQPDVMLSDLLELPSTAPANAYMALKQGVTARRSDGVISFTCTLANISDVVCTSAGVEVELYDAASNFIGSSSSWAHRDIQPGETLQLSFENKNNRDAYAFCVTKIGGGFIARDEGSLVPQQSDVLGEAIPITPDEIALAQGDNPYRWIVQQDGKKFVVTGSVSQVLPGENDRMWVVKIGEGRGACYVTFLYPDTALIDRMNQLVSGTEVCMSGVCVALDFDQPRFILADGAFEK